MNTRSKWLGVAGVLLATLSLLPTVNAQVLTGACLNSAVPLSVEEQRLNRVLPENNNLTIPQSTPIPQQLIEGAGFQDFAPAFISDLCDAHNFRAAKAIVFTKGQHLWRAAVDRAQGRRTGGTLPASDDRPLYWTRLQMSAALRQWVPDFYLSDDGRDDLLWNFERASRGQFDINFPPGKHVKRLIMSGFDPFTLDFSLDPVAQSKGIENGILIGNPSGATILSLDGTQHKSPDGSLVYIQTYILPVNYGPFKQGMQEDTIGPFIMPGPFEVGASITMSQGGDDQFWLEQFNGRYHGPFYGNDNIAFCPSINNVPQLAIDNHDCNIIVVPRWGGPRHFDLFNPPQWTETSNPIAEMIAADTGVGIPKPPGDTWTGPGAFQVIWHTTFDEFPSCYSTTVETFNSYGGVGGASTFPPPVPPTPPDPGSCAYNGGGGNYLSNESAFRNTTLRNRYHRDIPAGHIHVPVMTHFAAGDITVLTDSTFEAWRESIKEQARRLVFVVADSIPSKK